MTSKQIADRFDLAHLDDAYIADPYPTYDALRINAPVKRMADGTLFVSQYKDVARILKDSKTFSSDKKRDFLPKFGESPLYEHHTTSIVFNDPPYHTRVRSLLTPFFSPRVLELLRKQVVALVDELLEEVSAKGEFEVVEDFLAPLPLNLVGDMLGIPKAEREPLRGWAQSILGALEPVLSEEEQREGNRSVAAFKDYLREQIAIKRKDGAGREPTDVLAVLLDAHDQEDDALTELELLHNCIFMLNAGHDTTTSLMANGMDLLFRFPDQLERLREAPTLMPTAIEEMLRFESPLQIGNRRAVFETEIGGVSVSDGTFIHIGIGSADRDDDQFPNADHFDIGRKPNRHLAFGHGIHTCAGNSLARMEAGIAIGRLLERAPNLTQAAPTRRARRARFRVIEELRIAF